MSKCSFCGKEYAFHRGVTLFTNTGLTLNFCSSKCRKNLELGRDKKKVLWVKKKGLLREEIIEETEKKEKKE